jgi:hypothetical protein
VKSSTGQVLSEAHQARFYPTDELAPEKPWPGLLGSRTIFIIVATWHLKHERGLRLWEVAGDEDVFIRYSLRPPGKPRLGVAPTGSSPEVILSLVPICPLTVAWSGEPASGKISPRMHPGFAVVDDLDRKYLAWRLVDRSRRHFTLSFMIVNEVTIPVTKTSH